MPEEPAGNTIARLQAWLSAFDAKERNHVLRHFLGEDQYQTFDAGILRALEAAVPALGQVTPSGLIFNCMDFHLDWLWAALQACDQGLDPAGTAELGTAWKLDESVRGFLDKPESRKADAKFQFINFTQQDTDWVVCIREGTEQEPRIRVVLVECKYAASWNPEQLAGKLVRTFLLQQKFPKIGQLPLRFDLVTMAPDPPKAEIYAAVQKKFSEHLNQDPQFKVQVPLPFVKFGNTRGPGATWRVARCCAPEDYREGTANEHITANKHGDHWGILQRRISQS